MNTELVSQVKSCGKICEIGSLLLIRGKTITSSTNHATAGLGCGSSKDAPFQIGNGPVPFFGFMGNVGFLPCPSTFTETVAFPFRSRLRKEHPLVRHSFDVSTPGTYGGGQFHNHPGHR